MYTVILLELFKCSGKTVKRYTTLYSGEDAKQANIVEFEHACSYCKVERKSVDGNVTVTITDKQF